MRGGEAHELGFEGIELGHKFDSLDPALLRRMSVKRHEARSPSSRVYWQLPGNLAR